MDSTYIPYTERAGLSPEERADSDQYDAETGETDRRIREQDRISREFNAAQRVKAQS